jgi:glutathione-regulated potassium-efflux system ancillary protein KefG
MPTQNLRIPWPTGFCLNRLYSCERHRARSLRALSRFFIDIAHEQDLLRQHEVIVFQHPLYTWSCPALLKEWLDRVLSRGFASGAGGNQLAGKYWRSVITTGEPESAYRRDANRYPMNDILRPFELTAGMCRMHWMSPIIVYWARHNRLKI